jgi:hypothetical protein
MATSRSEQIRDLLSQAATFRFCGPSDDPDEITAVTLGFGYLVTQIKHIARPIVPEELAAKLDALTVDPHDLYSAFDAKAELDGLSTDLEEALEVADSSPRQLHAGWIVDPDLISKIEQSNGSRLNVVHLVRVLREINSSLAHGNVVATALLMRAVLNHVPPVWGHQNFDRVVASVGRSLKDSYMHLEDGLRKIADFHTHKRIDETDTYPSRAQVEPFKPQFELLLQNVLAALAAG